MHELTCWCGSRALEPFAPGYRLCSECGTLVSAELRGGNRQSKREKIARFYDRHYWFQHQEELGNPDIEQRAVQDLPERCVSWLWTLLSLKLPPARVLEIGCAHGGLLALAEWAGFDVLGLEISPWTADFAGDTFAIPVLSGDLEDHELPANSFGAIFLLDVLEHLPDPVRMLNRCCDLLTEDGLLFIQTPRFPDVEKMEALEAANSSFLKMMLPREHLFLFNQDSIEQLCRATGFAHHTYRPTLFPYDLFLIAASAPVPRCHSDEEIRNALTEGPSRRLVLALLQACGHLNECQT